MELFDFVIVDLGEKLTKLVILEFHRMLKQCIENNICLIGIDEKYNDEYKNATYEGKKIIKSPTVQSIYDVENVKRHVFRRQ